jgi:hypothetical protein
MEFALSTFTLEVNQTPMLVFEAKWAAEAEGIGFGWADDHADRLSTKGSHGSELPAVTKVRVANAAEKAAYLVAGNTWEFYKGVKLVYLS